MKLNYVKKWPSAYELACGSPESDYHSELCYKLNWPNDVPPPAGEMKKKGAIFLGRGKRGSSTPCFRGWQIPQSKVERLWNFSGNWGGTSERHLYALDPSDPNADEIIREFRPDLVQATTPMTYSEEEAIERALWKSVDQPEPHTDAPWTATRYYRVMDKDVAEKDEAIVIAKEQVQKDGTLVQIYVCEYRERAEYVVAPSEPVVRRVGESDEAGEG